MVVPNGWALAAAVAVGALAACNSGGKTAYSQSPDSGAVAPAARLDTSMRREMPADTTRPRPADTTKKRP